MLSDRSDFDYKSCVLLRAQHALDNPAVGFLPSGRGKPTGLDHALPSHSFPSSSSPSATTLYSWANFYQLSCGFLLSWTFTGMRDRKLTVY